MAHLFKHTKKTKTTIMIDREDYFMLFLVVEIRFSGGIQIKTECHQVAD